MSSKPIKKVFTLGLSVGLVIGIATSVVLSPIVLTSLFHFHREAKAITSTISGVREGAHKTSHKNVTRWLVIERVALQMKPQNKPETVWTFNGTVPGPTLNFTEGDNVTLHVINNMDNIQGNNASKYGVSKYHTFHLHVDHQALYDGVFGDNAVWNPATHKRSDTIYSFIAEPAGAFPYHCHSMDQATSQHMRMGMYGLMIVEPKPGSIEAGKLKPAREYGIVMGEYSDNGTLLGGPGSYHTAVDPLIGSQFTNATTSQKGDPHGNFLSWKTYIGPKITSNFEALMALLPKYFLNNGYWDQYLENPLPAWQNETVRLYVVNDGVGLVYPFHIHGQIFKVYPSGLLTNNPEDRQTYLIGPGDAAIIEINWTWPGSYLFHAHGIEEENGGMGCFYVIPSPSNVALEDTSGICGMAPAHIHIPHQTFQSTKTAMINEAGREITDKSHSMIKWQEKVQQKLQDPMCLDKNGNPSHPLNVTETLKDGKPNPTYEIC